MKDRLHSQQMAVFWCDNFLYRSQKRKPHICGKTGVHCRRYLARPGVFGRSLEHHGHDNLPTHTGGHNVSLPCQGTQISTKKCHPREISPLLPRQQIIEPDDTRRRFQNPTIASRTRISNHILSLHLLRIVQGTTPYPLAARIHST